MPELIQFKEGHQIKHLYDATGKKLETQYITLLQGLYNPLIPGEIMDDLDVSDLDLVTINGTVYIGNKEYHLSRYFDWDVSYAPKSVFTLNRVHNPERYTTYANLKLNKTGPIYHYYRRDHLGNNREVWQAEHLFNSKPKLASTIQRTQYYPSGLPWKSSTADGAALQPYKYGGKEFVETHGLDEYYSYARNVYPAIMRTTTLDPHAESYYSVSPYAWCGNNPVNRVDLNGRDWLDAQGNKITDHNNIKVYIFYDPESFDSQSKQMYKDAVEKYGEGSVVMSNVTTMADFIQDWGDMTSGDIKEVNLNYHGNNQTVMLNSSQDQYITATGDGKTNRSRTPATNVQDLSVPMGNISNAQLNLNTCKSNSKTQYELKGSKQTLMESFYNSFSFKTVRGTVDGVSYDRTSKQPFPGRTLWRGTWDYMRRPILQPLGYPGKGLPLP